MTTRRRFIATVIPVSASLLGMVPVVIAQAARLEESDALAVSLGYKHDASKVDAKKHDTFASGRDCANCQLYAGKPGDSWGLCSMMGGKLVNSKGWCVAWAKKA